jgi:two-component system phosphate regulon sensor histidine kinase PhoR
LTLATRFAIGAALLSGVAAALLSVAANGLVRATLEERLMEELRREASLVAVALQSRGGTPNVLAHRYGRILNRRVTLIDSKGTVLGDSEFDHVALALLENQSDRPEVREAMATGRGTAKRYSSSTGRVEFKAAVRSGNWVVRVSAPVAELEPALNRARRSTLFAALVSVLLSVLVARRAGSWVASELRRLADTAARPWSVAASAPSRIPEFATVATAVAATRGEALRLSEKLQREEEAWESIIESLGDGVLAFDAEGEARIVNRAARELLGYSATQSIPPLAELFRQREVREVLGNLDRGEKSAEAEVQLGERTVLLLARALPEGGRVLLLRDTTELRKLEAVRRDFVANVSHELKTPLTSISGYTETLLAEGDYPPHRRHFLEIILQNAHRMRRLVDDLLELALLESQQVQLSPQPLELAAAAQEAFDLFQERAEQKGVSFVVELPQPCLVRADPEALRRILVNLFDNSLRHTPFGGKIKVIAREMNGDLEVGIADTGTGIPREHLPRVFERFYRVDAGRSRATGGTGLGLSIVKHLVEAQGGSVRIESALGQGTTVWLRFPKGAS